MAQYDSVDSFVNDYKVQNPQFKDWGNEVLYSVIVKSHPNTPSAIKDAPAPAVTDWSSMVSRYKQKNPDLADTPDIDVANSLRESFPALKVFDAPPETPEQRFARENPNWIGRPITTGQTSELFTRYKEIQEANKKGRQGFWEAMHPEVGDSPFFIGDVLDAGKSLSVMRTAEKLSEGREVTDEELVKLNLFLADGDRDSNAALAGKVGSIVRGSVSFGTDLAVTGALLAIPGGQVAGGVAAGGTFAKLAQRMGSRAAFNTVKQAVETKLSKYLTNSVGGTLARKTLAHAAGASVMGAAQTGIQTLAEAAGGEGTKTGANIRRTYDLLQGDASSPYWKYYMADLGSNFAESASEFSGEWLRGGFKGLVGLTPAAEWGAQVAKRIEATTGKAAEALRDAGMAPEEIAKRVAGVQGRLKKAVLKGAMLNELANKYNITYDASKRMLRGVGYDGILEEMGEERVAGFMQGLLGTDGGPGGLKAAFEGMVPDTAEDLEAEAIAFALPLGYAQGIRQLSYSKMFGGKGWSLTNQMLSATQGLLPADLQAVVDNEERQNQEKQAEDLAAIFREPAGSNPGFTSAFGKFIIDLAALPATMDFSGFMYGSASKALAHNSLPLVTDLMSKSYDAYLESVGKTYQTATAEEKDAADKQSRAAYRAMRDIYWSKAIKVQQDHKEFLDGLLKQNGISINSENDRKMFALATAQRMLETKGGYTDEQMDELRRISKVHGVIQEEMSVEAANKRYGVSGARLNMFASAEEAHKAFDPGNVDEFARYAIRAGYRLDNLQTRNRAAKEFNTTRELLRQYKDDVHVGSVWARKTDTKDAVTVKEVDVTTGDVTFEGRPGAMKTADLHKDYERADMVVHFRLTPIRIRDTAENLKKAYPYFRESDFEKNRNRDGTYTIRPGAYTSRDAKTGLVNLTVDLSSSSGYHFLEDTLHLRWMLDPTSRGTGRDEYIGDEGAAFLAAVGKHLKDTGHDDSDLYRLVTSNGAAERMEALHKIWLHKKLNFDVYNEAVIGDSSLAMASDMFFLPDNLESLDPATWEAVDKKATRLLGGLDKLGLLKNQQLDDAGVAARRAEIRKHRGLDATGKAVGAGATTGAPAKPGAKAAPAETQETKGPTPKEEEPAEKAGAAEKPVVVPLPATPVAQVTEGQQGKSEEATADDAHNVLDALFSGTTSGVPPGTPEATDEGKVLFGIKMGTVIQAPGDTEGSSEVKLASLGRDDAAALFVQGLSSAQRKRQALNKPLITKEELVKPEIQKELLAEGYMELLGKTSVGSPLVNRLYRLMSTGVDTNPVGVDNNTRTNDAEGPEAEEGADTMYQGDMDRLEDALDRKRLLLAHIERVFGTRAAPAVLNRMFSEKRNRPTKLAALRGDAEYKAWLVAKDTDTIEEKVVKDGLRIMRPNAGKTILYELANDVNKHYTVIELKYKQDKKNPKGHSGEITSVVLRSPSFPATGNMLRVARRQVTQVIREASRSQEGTTAFQARLNALRMNYKTRMMDAPRETVAEFLAYISGEPYGWLQALQNPKAEAEIHDNLVDVITKLRGGKDAKGVTVGMSEGDIKRLVFQLVFAKEYARTGERVKNSRFKRLLDAAFSDNVSSRIPKPNGGSVPSRGPSHPIDEVYTPLVGDTKNGMKLLGHTELLGANVALAGGESKGLNNDELSLADAMAISKIIYDRKDLSLFGQADIMVLPIPSGDKERIISLVVTKPKAASFEEAYKVAMDTWMEPLVGPLEDWTEAELAKRIRLMSTVGYQSWQDGTHKMLVLDAEKTDKGGDPVVAIIRDLSNPNAAPMEIGSKALLGAQQWGPDSWKALVTGFMLPDTSTNLKAYAYTKGMGLLTKSNHAGSKNVDPSRPETLIAYGLEKEHGINTFTDKDATKREPAKGTGKPFDQTVQFSYGGRNYSIQLKGTVYEVPNQALRYTTNLEKNADIHDKASSSPVVYDHSAINPVVFLWLEKYVNYSLDVSDIQATVLRSILESDDVSPAIRALIEAGVPLSYYGISAPLRQRIMAAVKKQITPYMPAVYAILRPAWIESVMPDAFLRDASRTEDGKTKSAWVHATVNGARYGYRAYMFAGKAELVETILAAANGDEAARARLSRDGATESLVDNAAASKTTDWWDLVAEVDGNKRAVRLHEHEIEEGKDENGDPMFIIPGTQAIIDRVPGGPSAHIPVRIMRPVSRENSAEIKIHTDTLLRAGPDADGDKYSIMMWNKDADGRIMGLHDGATEVTPGADVQGAQRAQVIARSKKILANRMLEAEFTSFDVAPKTDALLSAIEVNFLDGINVTAMEDGKPVVKTLKQWRESGRRDLADLATQIWLGTLAKGSTQTRAYVVSAYRQFQMVMRYGGATVTFGGRKADEEGGIKLTANGDFRTFSRNAPDPVSDGLAASALGNMVNIVIDDIKSPRSGFLALSKDTVVPLALLLSMQKFETKDDVKSFMSWWTAWTSSAPVAHLLRSLRKTSAFDYLGTDRFINQLDSAVAAILGDENLSSAYKEEAIKASAILRTALRMSLWGKAYNLPYKPPTTDIAYVSYLNGQYVRGYGAKATADPSEIQLAGVVTPAAGKLPAFEEKFLEVAGKDVFFDASNPVGIMLAARRTLADKMEPVDAAEIRKITPGRLARRAEKALPVEVLTSKAMLDTGYGLTQDLLSRLIKYRGDRAKDPARAFLDNMGGVVDKILNAVVPMVGSVENAFIDQLHSDPAGKKRRKPGIASQPQDLDVDYVTELQEALDNIEKALPEKVDTEGLSGYKLTRKDIKPVLALYALMTFGLDTKQARNNFVWAFPASFHKALHEGLTELHGYVTDPAKIDGPVMKALALDLKGGMKYNYIPSFFRTGDAVDFKGDVDAEDTESQKLPEKDVVAKVPAQAPAFNINDVSEYRGLPVRREAGKPHLVHGGKPAAALRTDSAGARYISLDLAETASQFRNKQWTKPRVPGITALPADAFPTISDWGQFVMEHEFQHTKFPSVKMADSMAKYVANEEAINRAAAEALGIQDRLYPKAPAVTQAPTNITAGSSGERGGLITQPPAGSTPAPATNLGVAPAVAPTQPPPTGESPAPKVTPVSRVAGTPKNELVKLRALTPALVVADVTEGLDRYRSFLLEDPVGKAIDRIDDQYERTDIGVFGRWMGGIVEDLVRGSSAMSDAVLGRWRPLAALKAEFDPDVTGDVGPNLLARRMRELFPNVVAVTSNLADLTTDIMDDSALVDDDVVRGAQEYKAARGVKLKAAIGIVGVLEYIRRSHSDLNKELPALLSDDVYSFVARQLGLGGAPVAPAPEAPVAQAAPPVETQVPAPGAAQVAEEPVATEKEPELLPATIIPGKIVLANGKIVDATEGQAKVLSALENVVDSVFKPGVKAPAITVVKGEPGTGKTTILNELLRRGRLLYGDKLRPASDINTQGGVALVAVQHRAAGVMRFMTSFFSVYMSPWAGKRTTRMSYPTGTVAKLLGSKPQADGSFKAPSVKAALASRFPPAIARTRLLILDEASFLPDTELDLILDWQKATGMKIIVLGDAAQLPQVRGKDSTRGMTAADIGRVFTPEFVSATNASVLELNQVMRQATGNPLTALLTRTRKAIMGTSADAARTAVSARPEEVSINPKGEGVAIARSLKDALDLLGDRFTAVTTATNPNAVRIVAATNVQSFEANKAVYERLFPDAGGRPVMPNTLLTAHDIVPEDSDRSAAAHLLGDLTFPVRNNSDDFVVRTVSEKMTVPEQRVSEEFTVPTLSGYRIAMSPVPYGMPISTETVGMFVLANESFDTYRNFLKRMSDRVSRMHSEARERGGGKLHAPAYELEKMLKGLYDSVLSLKPVTIQGDVPEQGAASAGDRGRTLDYGYAGTIYKAQGGTFGFAIVYAGSSIANTKFHVFTKAQNAYVGESRAKNAVIMIQSEGNTPDAKETAALRAAVTRELDVTPKPPAFAEDMASWGTVTKDAKGTYTSSYTPPAPGTASLSGDQETRKISPMSYKNVISRTSYLFRKKLWKGSEPFKPTAADRKAMREMNARWQPMLDEVLKEPTASLRFAKFKEVFGQVGDMIEYKVNIRTLLEAEVAKEQMVEEMSEKDRPDRGFPGMASLGSDAGPVRGFDQGVPAGLAQQLSSFFKAQGFIVRPLPENSVYSLFSVAAKHLQDPEIDKERFFKDASSALANLWYVDFHPGEQPTSDKLARFAGTIRAEIQLRATEGKSKLRVAMDSLVAFLRGLFKSPDFRNRLNDALDEALTTGRSSRYSRTPAPGMTPLSLQAVMDAEPRAIDVLRVVTSSGIPYRLTGSGAYAAQGIKVYRQGADYGHDHDLVFASAADAHRAYEAVVSAFPESKIFYTFTKDMDYVLGLVVPPEGYSVDVGRTLYGAPAREKGLRYQRNYTLLKGGVPVADYSLAIRMDRSREEVFTGDRAIRPVVIDFLHASQAVFGPVVRVSVNDSKGVPVPIDANPYPLGFAAKLAFARAKDLQDYALMDAVDLAGAVDLPSADQKRPDRMLPGSASLSADAQETRILDIPSVPERYLEGVDLKDPGVQGNLEAGASAFPNDTMASLATYDVLRVSMDDLFNNGVNKLHRLIMDAGMKEMEILLEAGRALQQEKIALYGLGPTNTIKSLKEYKSVFTGKPVKLLPIFRGKKYKWTVPEVDMLNQWMHAEKTLFMSRGFQALLDRKLGDNKYPDLSTAAGDKAMRTALASITAAELKRVMDNELIVWGSRKDPEDPTKTYGTTDPFTGMKVPETETLSAFRARWANANNTVPDVLKRMGREFSMDLGSVYQKGDTFMKNAAFTDFLIARRLLDKWFKINPNWKYFHGYLPLLYSATGFLDVKGRAEKDAIDRYVRSMDTKGDVLLSEEDLKWDFETGEIPVPSQAQKDLLVKLVKANMKDPAKFNAETHATEVAGWTGWDFNAAIKKELLRNIYKTANPAMVLSKDEWKGDVKPGDTELDKKIRTLKRLNKTIGNYRYPEWTARELTRTLRNKEGYRVQTYSEVYEVTEGRLLPSTDSLFDSVYNYAHEIVRGTINKLTLNKMLVTPDYDGKPLILLEPSELGISSRTGAPVERKETEEPFIKQVIHDETWRTYGRILYDYIVNHRKGANIPPYVATADMNAVRRQIKDMVNVLANGEEYKLHRSSPYASVSRIWGARGKPNQILNHIVGDPFRIMVGDTDVMKYLHGINQWMKTGAVGWGLFFPISLVESLVAGTGLKNNILRHPIRNTKEIIAIMRELHSPYSMRFRAEEKGAKGADIWDFTTDLAASGGEVDVANITENAKGTVQKHMAAAHEAIRLSQGQKQADMFLRTSRVISGQAMSDFWFGELFPAMKVWAARRYVEEESQKRYSKSYDTLTSNERKVLLRDAANIINDAYGGQFWRRYTWATPKMLQVLNLVMFAPNWTLSSFNTTGGGMITGGLLQNYMSPANKDFVFYKNWPAMYVLAMVAGPLLAQSAIYAAAAGLGGGDPDDRPFPWQNEPGRADSVLGLPYNWYVDMTPLARMMPGYEGAPTGQRRVYARFGKQAYEVLDGWLAEPVAQALRKLSQPAKLVIEELTGKSPGSDWNLEFNGMGMMGWFMVDREGVDAFMGSRVGYAVQKFLPMSLLSGLKNPDSWVVGIVAPASKGTSQAKAIEELTKILRTYGDTTSWRQVSKDPNAEQNLRNLAPALLDALQRNGYDPDKALKSAKGVVLGQYYTQMWDAIQKDDTERVEELSRSILRVGGTIDGLQRSITQKGKQYRREVTPEMRQAMRDAFGKEAPPEPPAPRTVTRPSGVVSTKPTEAEKESRWVAAAKRVYQDKYGKLPETDAEIAFAEELAKVPKKYRTYGKPVISTEK